MNFTIKNEQIEHFNESKSYLFPKYTSQLINWANQNAQGTRPIVVGQMSELFPEFIKSTSDISIDAWKAWYLERYPDSFDKATQKIYLQVKNLREAIQYIDEDMVRHWVMDLVINKTFNGLYVQKVILATLAQKIGKAYRLAAPVEESKGIDGFIGNIPYSVKPDTYKTMGRLPENIDVR